MSCFNPRAHAGRDLIIQGFTANISGFNPRAHAGRDLLILIGYLSNSSFNPRAHAGRDPTLPIAKTEIGSFNPRAHAGRDSTGVLGDTSVTLFQSTRPRGARRIFSLIIMVISQVSSHAPTRGATTQCWKRWQIRSSFNPRAHAGRD